MQRQIGGILLVAGTCIGSGMIALPMVLANLGILPSIALMFVMWGLIYYTSLINIELNLQAGHGLALGALGRHFSGRGAEIIGNISLKVLSYSLLAVYVYGGTSVLQQLIANHLHLHFSFISIATWYSAIAGAVLLLPLLMIDYCNRVLFTGLLAVIGLLTAGLAVTMQVEDTPLVSPGVADAAAWSGLLPVVFTSFGFQVIFHTLTDYCHKNSVMLKKVFFWGSLIPALVYIVWTGTLLAVVFHNNPAFYTEMAQGKVEVGSLIATLSQIAKWPAIQLLVWWISLLAIVTSVIGVGLGLFQSLLRMIPSVITAPSLRAFFAVAAAMIPPYLVAIFVPNAFISVLGFAGMILAVIAIVLPIYLFWKMGVKDYFYPELGKRVWVILSLLAALLIIASELFNMSS